MKRILSLLFLAQFFLPSFAQDSDYRPFVEEGKLWISYNPVDLMNRNKGYIQYDRIEGDTLVNGQPCKIWVQHYVREADGQEMTFRIPVYEENRKVWFFMNGDKTPRMAYDFSAEAGERVIAQLVEAQYMDYYEKYLSDKFVYADLYTDTIRVKSKANVLVGGREQKVTYYMSALMDDANLMRYVYIMEGIGNNQGPYRNIGPNPRAWNGAASLICCSVGDELLYFDSEEAKNNNIPLPTSITSPRSPQMANSKSVNSTWLDLSGRRFSASPTRPGVYLRDGRKVLVK